MKILITKILDSKLFSLIAALLIISFGLYKWGSFSRNVDEIAANALRKKTVKSVSIQTNFSSNDFQNFQSNYYNENVYEFKKYPGYYQSREFDESDSLSYFFSVPADQSKFVTLKIHYTKLPDSFDLNRHSANCLSALEKIIFNK
ncbi:MAG: hypothetical protein WHV28_09720 [Bacteroidota bacterium]